MSNLALIRHRRIVFRTSQNTDWLDGLPMLGLLGQGGVSPIPGNVGNGTLTINGIGGGGRSFSGTTFSHIEVEEYAA